MMILNEYINGLLGTLHIEPFIMWVDITFYIFQLAFQHEFSKLFQRHCQIPQEQYHHFSSREGVLHMLCHWEFLTKCFRERSSNVRNDTQLQFKIATYATTTVGSCFLLLYTGCAHGLCVYLL